MKKVEVKNIDKDKNILTIKGLKKPFITLPAGASHVFGSQEDYIPYQRTVEVLKGSGRVSVTIHEGKEEAKKEEKPESKPEQKAEAPVTPEPEKKVPAKKKVV